MARQRFRVISLSDRHAQVNLSDRITVITQALTRKGKNRRMAKLVSAYFGFESQDEAQLFVKGLRRYFPKAFCQIRKGQRVDMPVEVKVRDFNGLERFIWALIEQPAIVSSTAAMTAAEARDSIFPSEPAATSNVISFVDRSTAPLASRSRGMTATVGNRVVNIE
jgi:hypothetical protein